MADSDAHFNPRTLAPDYVRWKPLFAAMFASHDKLGMEIGAFDRPYFTKAEANVRYLDYKTTQQLRDEADLFAGHNSYFVQEVDYLVPGSGSWDEAPDSAFDWILSSHVLEHSPNLIAFLRVMNAKLKRGGLAVIMLPDKRRTYDALKPPTTLGRVFEDYYTGRTSPRFQSTFDDLYYTRNLSIEEADRVHLRSATQIPSGMHLQECLRRAKISLHTYQDQHNYIFTSHTFETIITEVCLSGLIGMNLLLHEHTRDDEMTFLSILKKTGEPVD